MKLHVIGSSSSGNCYVLDNGKFKFEKDIQDNRPRKIERLRALILQEAFN